MTREAAKVGLRHQSLRDAVVDELRELIIDGALPPGKRLVERELGEQLDVSRVPLREGILQLEAEGLVRRVPRRGSVVATLTQADVVDLFDVRESLETLAAGLAAERAEPAALAALGQYLDQAAKAAEKRQTNTIAELNVAFHNEIVRAARNALLSTMTAPLHSRMRWLFRLLTAGAEDPAALCQEHSEIYDAIAAGDRAQAEHLARTHVAKTREPTLALFAALDDPPLPADVSRTNR